MDNEEFNLEVLNKEHLLLSEDLFQAKLDKNIELVDQLESRISYLESKIWKIKTVKFQELAKYSSFLDALKHTASELQVPFPEISFSRENQFLFSVSDSDREVLIVPRENIGSYWVCLNSKYSERSLSYRGGTDSLKQVVFVLSHWYIRRDPIHQICQDYPWISNSPVEIPG